MARLFAEHFLTKALPAPAAPSYAYDAILALNCLPDGTAAVELDSAPGTSTLTEVDGERSDEDRPEPDTRTLTFVEAEIDDPMQSAQALGTRTAPRGEDPDRYALLRTRTETKVAPESSDFACF